MRFLQLLQAELRREFRLWWSYRFDSISWIVMWAFGFPLLILVFDAVAGGYSPEARLASLIGFLIWDLCSSMLGFTASSIEEGSSEGTLEATLLSDHQPAVVFLARNLANLVFRFVETGILGVVLNLALRVPVAFTPATFLSILLTAWGAIGFGLVLGGLALVFKQVSSLATLTAYLSLILSGAIVPLDRLSFFVALKLFWPLTWGIALVRHTQAERWSLLRWASSPDMWGVLAQAVILTGLGLATFRWGLARASKQGSLATY